MRDIKVRPYSADELRVCDLLQRLAPDLGCGDDPIGFLIASYAGLADRQRSAREALGFYSEAANYRPSGWQGDIDPAPVLIDAGAKARSALAV